MGREREFVNKNSPFEAADDSLPIKYGVVWTSSLTLVINSPDDLAEKAAWPGRLCPGHFWNSVYAQVAASPSFQ